MSTFIIFASTTTLIFYSSAVDTIVNSILDFPGDPVVKNLPSQCKIHGFDPWSGKIPHATGQLSLKAATTEAHTPLEPILCNKRSHHNEKPVHHN